MRKYFSKILYDKMKTNSNIYLITADLGYGLWDKIKDDYPNRFYNVGSSEMVMMGIGVGLAMEGKIPFVYSITPFAIYRPFEMIRNYLDHEEIPVHIVGGGRNKDYGALGFSHWAEEDKKIMNCFNNRSVYHPEQEYEIDQIVDNMLNDNRPSYLNLKK